jgi:predicted acylesterase/phospholipase RssA
MASGDGRHVNEYSDRRLRPSQYSAHNRRGNVKYDLVFEGGGAKGMVFVGALQEFEAAGHSGDRLLGTSAGAITAALIAAGYTSERMLEALGEEEDGQPVFAGFMGIPGPFDDVAIDRSATIELLQRVDLPFVPERWERKLDRKIVDGLLAIERYRHIFSFVEHGGWFAATKFLTWMKRKLGTAANGSPTGFDSATLSEFFDATGKELCLIASDTTAQKILVLNHRTAPDCPLVWAVRMSMSIPLVWQEVEWETDWGQYRGHDVAGHLIFDGGMLSNFPIELLVSDQPQVTEVMGEKRSQAVLGLLIDEALPVPDAPQGIQDEGGLQWSQLRTVRRILALIDTMTKAHDKQVIDAFEDLVVRLPARGYGTTEFGMSNERKAALVAAGRTAMKAWLDRQARPRPSAAARGAVMVPERDRRAAAADRIAAGILAAGR